MHQLNWLQTDHYQCRMTEDSRLRSLILDPDQHPITKSLLESLELAITNTKASRGVINNLIKRDPREQIEQYYFWYDAVVASCNSAKMKTTYENPMIAKFQITMRAMLKLCWALEGLYYHKYKPETMSNYIVSIGFLETMMSNFCCALVQK